MKKALLLALFGGLLFFGKPVQAQNNLLKVNLLAPLVSTGSFYYERVLGDSRSIQVGAFFTKFEELSGYGITPEYRVYLSDEPAPAGFYVAPFASFMSFTIESDEDYMNDFKATARNFGGGLVVGRQWIFKEMVSFDMFIGPEYTVGNMEFISGDREQAESANLTGWIGRAGISVGLKF
ncbi:DUF3575 domain-containing protein [Rufibacter sp. LB8]|uniref:DUF3575 domain-containing protein n=1 Tax=Rufibacter sp. LB8 TaxID=2777781 RepID=UPI00178C6D17|nr:DUF3575 domain-containing protein [Rufibacter sp. LB8]